MELNNYGLPFESPWVRLLMDTSEAEQDRKHQRYGNGVGTWGIRDSRQFFCQEGSSHQHFSSESMP